MKNKFLINFCAFLLAYTGYISAKAQQEELPFRQIEEYPEDYTIGLVAARMIEGLGFRFYWATDGLTENDLKFRPNESARNINETVDHIYGMTFMIGLSLQLDKSEMFQGEGFQGKRKATLQNLALIRDILKNSTEEDFHKYVIDYDNGKKLPFWNMINGPISDSLWHCGQIVSFRRSAGNPFNGKVSVLHGKVRRD
ncbi:MAG: hypothetical protein R3345_01105 [Fulvivirga sp.]|nr:hypothetical protein [Fulvivirga sp.]